MNARESSYTENTIHCEWYNYTFRIPARPVTLASLGPGGGNNRWVWLRRWPLQCRELHHYRSPVAQPRLPAPPLDAGEKLRVSLSAFLTSDFLINEQLNVDVLHV